MSNNGLVNTPPAGFKASLRSRIIVAAILVAIFIPAFALGGWVCFFVFMAFLSLALIEVLLAPHKRYGWWIWVFTFVVTFCYVYWFILKGNLIGYRKDPENYSFSLENYFSTLDISVVGIAAALIGYFIIAIFDKNFDFSDVSYLFTMTILLGLGFQTFYFVRYFPFFVYGFSSAYHDYSGLIISGVSGPSVIQQVGFKYWGSITMEVYVFIGVIANDVFAYFGGVYFGKHKMNPRISPKKTWEGFWFGAVISFLLSSTWGLALAFTGWPMLPFLDRSNFYWILLISFILPLLSDLGDLSFSLIKRHYGIKDYGNILRGHGGVLDRFDSTIFAMIGVSIILIFLLHEFDFLL